MQAASWKSLTFAALAMVSQLSITRAESALLSFSGGSGTPLTITVASSLDFNIYQSTPSVWFTFQNVGDFFSSNPTGSGTLQYQLNHAGSETFDSVESGFAGGNTALDDMYFRPTNSASLSFTPGVTVTLLAGSFTTSGNFAGAAPTDGVYNVFVADPGGNSVSGAVPEPSTWTLLGLGALGLIALRRRIACDVKS